MPIKDRSSKVPLVEQKRLKSLLVSLGISLLAFYGLLACFEFISRQGLLDQVFLMRSLGSYHSVFEIKWFKLQDFVRKNGGVDVIILGNSMVNTGIDPNILSSEYEAQIGKKLRIFNFGIEGLTVAPNSKLAKILSEEYHPGTILFVTEMRDFVAQNGLDVETKFESNPWIRGVLGTGYSFESKLISSSSFLQQMLVFRNWSRFDFLENYQTAIKRNENMNAAGYEEDPSIGGLFNQHPNPNDPNDRVNFDLFDHFKIDPGRLNDLRNILELNETGARIIITEMPIYPTFYEYFGGQAIHLQFQDEIDSFITINEGVYVEPVSWALIPFDGRDDYLHLNFRGAILYSRFLAWQLAAQCRSQHQCLLFSSPGGAQ
jgi:hypothetical protein